MRCGPFLSLWGAVWDNPTQQRARRRRPDPEENPARQAEKERRSVDEAAALRAGRVPGSSRCLFHRCRETRTKASALFIVVNDLGKELATRGSDESSSSHRDRRRASAKTSSATYAGVSPRSNAATRSSISRAQAASISEIGECSDSSKVSASWARSSAAKARAFCSTS